MILWWYAVFLIWYIPQVQVLGSVFPSPTVNLFVVQPLRSAMHVASFPVPRPAFHCLQYGKVGKAWYISSCEHDVIYKWQNFQIEDVTFCVLFNHISRSTLGEYDSRPPLARYVWYVTWYLCSSCCSETQYTHVHFKSFYP